MRFRPKEVNRKAFFEKFGALRNHHCVCAGYTWGAHHNAENGHHPMCPKVNAHNFRARTRSASAALAAKSEAPPVSLIDLAWQAKREHLFKTLRNQGCACENYAYTDVMVPKRGHHPACPVVNRRFYDRTDVASTDPRVQAVVDEHRTTRNRTRS